MINTNNPKDIINALDSGENVFLTGRAGAGKSYLIKEYLNNTKRNIALTATTGVAAINIGGETIHRFLGLGIACRPEEIGRLTAIWHNIYASKKPWDIEKCKLIDNLHAIIIDEVSMLRRDQFELISELLINLKGIDKPFGGVQLVLVGDFFQLPPVVTAEDLKEYPDLENPFCFQSDIWKNAGFKEFNLTTNYRQSDKKFLDILNKVRSGIVDKHVSKFAKDRFEVELNTHLEPVKLFSHKVNVEQENMRRLNVIDAEKANSKALYTGKEYDIGILKKECQAEELLTYCVGAQVMMLNNDKNGRWVNGSMGMITQINPDLKIELSSGEEVVVTKHVWERKIIKVENGKMMYFTGATCTQFPFKLAWATSIHKSQSLSFDYLDVDISNCFASGQAYVALSRARTIDGITIRGWNSKSIFVDKRIIEFYKDAE